MQTTWPDQILELASLVVCPAKERAKFLNFLIKYLDLHQSQQACFKEPSSSSPWSHRPFSLVFLQVFICDRLSLCISGWPQISYPPVLIPLSTENTGIHIPLPSFLALL